MRKLSSFIEDTQGVVFCYGFPGKQKIDANKFRVKKRKGCLIQKATTRKPE
jgi:hypothetical protein